MKSASVEHPEHYTSHPSGIECISITSHMNFCLGNAFKYIFRCELKHDKIEDLQKAIFYIEREIENEYKKIEVKREMPKAYERMRDKWEGRRDAKSI